MKMNYTEAAKERCLSLTDTEIDHIWDDIESMPEDADSEKWKKKLMAIAAEYVLSSRFALMRIFQHRSVSPQNIERDNSTGFEIKFSDGSVGIFKDISIEHAAVMEQEELDLYEKLMMDRASHQSGADYKSDLKLVRKALRNHQKKTTLLTKEEAMSLGHIIGLTLKEMEWFLLRVFNVEGGFRYNSSEDLIDAYVFLRTAEGHTGKSATELKSLYQLKYGLVAKTPHTENLDWTLDNGGSLSDNVRKWSADDSDDKFMDWMGERAEHLDLPSLTAIQIYRRLATWIYKPIHNEVLKEQGKDGTSLKAMFPDVDYAVHQDFNGEYWTDFAYKIRNARKNGDISILFENGEISEESCNAISHELLDRNQHLSSTNPHPDLTKPWRDMFVSEKGKISPNGGINTVRTRVKDILFGKSVKKVKGEDGKEHMIEVPLSSVTKNDMLYLLWFIACQCWGYGSDNPDVRTRLNEFVDVCENTLSDAGLPGFYPPHVMEQSMLLSIVYAYGCGQEGKDEPLIVYNDICEAFPEHRETKEQMDGFAPHNRILELRRSIKLNQTQLANILGVDQTTVSAWEKGKREPNDEQKGRMATLFDVSVEDLMKF